MFRFGKKWAGPRERKIYIFYILCIYMKLGKSKVWRSGGSLVVVLPKVVAENLNVKAGDTIMYKYEAGEIIVEKAEEI